MYLKYCIHFIKKINYSWNESKPEERFHHFQFLLTIIGGDGEYSEKTKETLSSDYMIPMPLENYPDLPRQHISTWCDWFRDQTVENKSKRI